MGFQFLTVVTCSIALLSATGGAQACVTDKQMPDGEVVTPIECAIDGLIQPLLAKLYLESQETLDTRLISAELRALDRHPLVKQTFEHWLSADQVEAMHTRELGGDVALIVQLERFAQSLPEAICATFDAEDLTFFEAGGSLQVLVRLMAVDKERNADASIDLADVTLHGCGVS